MKLTEECLTEKHYLLLGDECPDCTFVENAFTLLNLNYKKTSPPHLNKINPNTLAIIVCTSLESIHTEQLVKLSKKYRCPLIFCTSSNHPLPLVDDTALFLTIPFTKHILKQRLSQASFSPEETTFNATNDPILEKLVGHSQAVRTLKSLIKQVAHCDSSVLILGQSGTGKDVVANCIHQLSKRKSKAFIPINCGAIPSELMESELFGYEKGAFTGALARRAGRFELAHEGTLFLDEIGDMPLAMQVKLLRVIQERKLERVGGNQSIDIDTRLITATHKDLHDMISHSQFREDLFYRINVFPIYIPTLNERKDDIPLIIDHQLNKIHERLNYRIEFTEQALGMLCAYTWPGNIRELQNFLERMVILYPNQVVTEKHIFLAHQPISPQKISIHQEDFFKETTMA